MQVATRLILLTLFHGIFPFCAVGQQARESKPATETAKPAQLRRANVDETFELNIVERRFLEENFEASTAVSTDGSSRLNIQIGVGVAAERIEVLLRNVRGSVRFRGTLDRLFEIIGNRTTAPKPAPN